MIAIALAFFWYIDLIEFSEYEITTNYWHKKYNKIMTLNTMCKNTTIWILFIQKICQIHCNNEAKKVQVAITSYLWHKYGKNVYTSMYKYIYKLKAGFRPLDVFPLSVRPSSYDW